MKIRQIDPAVPSVIYERTVPKLTEAEKKAFKQQRKRDEKQRTAKASAPVDVTAGTTAATATSVGAASAGAPLPSVSSRTRARSASGPVVAASTVVVRPTYHMADSEDLWRISGAALAALRQHRPGGFVVSINRVGDCQFAAVGVQLRPPLDHTTVRAAVCQFLQSHSSVASSPNNQRTWAGEIEDFSQLSLPDWLAQMSRAGTFGDESTLRLASVCFRVRVIVVACADSDAPPNYERVYEPPNLPTDAPTVVVAHLPPREDADGIPLAPHYVAFVDPHLTPRPPFHVDEWPSARLPLAGGGGQARGITPTSSDNTTDDADEQSADEAALLLQADSVLPAPTTWVRFRTSSLQADAQWTFSLPAVHRTVSFGELRAHRVPVIRLHTQDVPHVGTKLRTRLCGRSGHGVRIGSGIAAPSVVLRAAGRSADAVDDLRLSSAEAASLGLEVHDLLPSVDPMNVPAMLRLLGPTLRDRLRLTAASERCQQPPVALTAMKPTAVHTELFLELADDAVMSAQALDMPLLQRVEKASAAFFFVWAWRRDAALHGDVQEWFLTSNQYDCIVNNFQNLVGLLLWAVALPPQLRDSVAVTVAVLGSQVVEAYLRLLRARPGAGDGNLDMSEILRSSGVMQTASLLKATRRTDFVFASHRKHRQLDCYVRPPQSTSQLTAKACIVQ
jgi:hypothetical protein